MYFWNIYTNSNVWNFTPLIVSNRSTRVRFIYSDTFTSLQKTISLYTVFSSVLSTHILEFVVTMETSVSRDTRFPTLHWRSSNLVGVRLSVVLVPVVRMLTCPDLRRLLDVIRSSSKRGFRDSFFLSGPWNQNRTTLDMPKDWIFWNSIIQTQQNSTTKPP